MHEVLSSRNLFLDSSDGVGQGDNFTLELSQDSITAGDGQQLVEVSIEHSTFGARRWRSSPSVGRLMAFLEFLDFLEFMETSTVAGPGPNPREIEISFGADGPLACVRGPWARQEHLHPVALR